MNDTPENYRHRAMLRLHEALMASIEEDPGIEGDARDGIVRSLAYATEFLGAIVAAAPAKSPEAKEALVQSTIWYFRKCVVNASDDEEEEITDDGKLPN